MKLKISITDIAHYVGGFLAGYYIFVCPVFSVLFSALFGLYEVVEAWKKGDLGYIEVREYLLGFLVGFFMYQIPMPFLPRV